MKAVYRWCAAVGCVAVSLFGCASTNPANDGGEGGEGGMGGMGPALVIQSALALEQDCSGPSGQPLAEGSWDLDADENYRAVLSVENTLPSSTNEGGLETNTASVSSFEISMETSGGVPVMLEGVITPYRTSTTIAIPPSVGGLPSVETALCLGIPAAYAPPIAGAGLDEVVLQIRAVGTTTGGEPVSSAPFEWPVDLCSGCMRIDCPGDPPSCTPGSNRRPWCEP